MDKVSITNSPGSEQTTHNNEEIHEEMATITEMHEETATITEMHEEMVTITEMHEEIEQIIDRLERKREKDRLSALVFDLCNLFVHYCLFPNCKDWYEFSEELGDKRADYEEGVIGLEHLESRRRPYPLSHLLLQSEEIMYLNHHLENTELRSVKRQKEFLVSLKRETWELLPPEQVGLVKEMMNKLEMVALERWIVK